MVSMNAQRCLTVRRSHITYDWYNARKGTEDVRVDYSRSLRGADQRQSSSEVDYSRLCCRGSNYYSRYDAIGGIGMCFYVILWSANSTGCPSERIMVLAQVSKQGFFDVVRSSGLKGLINGWQPTLYRDIVFNCLFFTCRELSVSSYTKWSGEEPMAFKRVWIGWPAGCLASVVACPLDVIKTRIQGQKLGKCACVTTL